MAKQETEKGEKEALKTQISLLKEDMKSLKDELLVSEFDRFEAEKIKIFKANYTTRMSLIGKES